MGYIYHIKSILAAVGVFLLYSLLLSPLYYFFSDQWIYLVGATLVFVFLNIIHTVSSIIIKNWRTDFIPNEEVQQYLETEMESVAKEVGIRTPRIKITPDVMMNASAMGLTQFTAQVHVTSGLLNNATPEEIRATIAHEAAHIKNRDILVMYILYSPYKVMITLHRVIIGVYNASRDTTERAVLFPLYVIVYFLSSATLALVHLVSRQREFLADIVGADLTDPDIEINKLIKITRHNSQVYNRVPRGSIDDLTQQFPLIDSNDLFATHPPTEKRIENIQDYFE